MKAAHTGRADDGQRENERRARDGRGAPRPGDHPEAALQTIQILSKSF